MTSEEVPGMDDIVHAIRTIHGRDEDGHCSECSMGYEWGGVNWPCETWKATQTPAERAEYEIRSAADAREREAAELAERYRSVDAEYAQLCTQARQMLDDRAQAAARLIHLIGLDRASVLLDIGPELLAYYERVSAVNLEKE